MFLSGILCLGWLKAEDGRYQFDHFFISPPCKLTYLPDAEDTLSVRQCHFLGGGMGTYHELFCPPRRTSPFCQFWKVYYKQGQIWCLIQWGQKSFSSLGTGSMVLFHSKIWLAAWSCVASSHWFNGISWGRRTVAGQRKKKGTKATARRSSKQLWIWVKRVLCGNLSVKEFERNISDPVQALLSPWNTAEWIYDTPFLVSGNGYSPGDCRKILLCVFKTWHLCQGKERRTC